MASAEPASVGIREELFVGFNHISIPVRDVKEARRFMIEVLGAEPKDNYAGTFTEVTLGGIIVGLSEKPSGWTGWDAEFPHYAFTVAPEKMQVLKERLESFGVKTHSIWTRHVGEEALMYFRDPSGNLFELYCKKGFKSAGEIPLAKSSGGDYTIDFGALNYEWKG